MGQPLWLGLLNVSVMPTFIGTSLLFYVAQRFDWWFGYTILFFVPFWVLGFFVWNFGAGLLIDRLLSNRPNAVVGPPCPYCSKPLASKYAQQCLHCGADWHNSRTA
ncbi:hypothetical protein [Rhodopirellula europaea]|uniref:hypothetical protein n=1 Tax=Rhodopirellula europaea TaxID=1263866 RepID=UPI003D291D1E|tara:strand:- start:72285 stop:72602 length:318 start_codon:yes stop_codon:yes gene_type:complete